MISTSPPTMPSRVAACELSAAATNFINKLAAARASSAEGSYRPSEITAKQREITTPTYSCDVHPTKHLPSYSVSVASDIGNRKSQEDRFCICTELIKGRDDVAFFGIFDGTVGDFASDNIKDLIIPRLVNSPPWGLIKTMLTTGDQNGSGETLPSEGATDNNNKCADDIIIPSEKASSDGEGGELTTLLTNAVGWSYLDADLDLIDLCRKNSNHYASTTAVTFLLAGDQGYIAHLGDSRVAIGYERDGSYFAQFMTSDHKPNLVDEQARIVNSGGSVEYLHNHNSKPFIRGGDFTVRKFKGEQPMQLQYSRAFGGKDLKMYGLSNEPDIKMIPIHQTLHVVILGSDGIWDVHSAESAVNVVLSAQSRGEDPAHCLVQSTLQDQRSKFQTSDNITAIVLSLNRNKK